MRFNIRLDLTIFEQFWNIKSNETEKKYKKKGEMVYNNLLMFMFEICKTDYPDCINFTIDFVNVGEASVLKTELIEMDIEVLKKQVINSFTCLQQFKNSKGGSEKFIKQNEKFLDSAFHRTNNLIVSFNKIIKDIAQLSSQYNLIGSTKPENIFGMICQICKFWQRIKFFSNKLSNSKEKREIVTNNVNEFLVERKKILEKKKNLQEVLIVCQHCYKMFKILAEIDGNRSKVQIII